MTAILEKFQKLRPTKRQLRFMKKLFLCLLVVVLSCVLLFNAGICDAFEAHAFAIATGVVIIIIMGLAACGITFLTVDQAQDAAEQVWPKLSEGTQKWLEMEASKSHVYGEIWHGIKCDVVNWTVDAFSDLCSAIVTLWGMLFPTVVYDKATDSIASSLAAGENFTFQLSKLIGQSEAIQLGFGGLDFFVYGPYFTDKPDYIKDWQSGYCVFGANFASTGFSLYKKAPVDRGLLPYDADTVFRFEFPSGSVDSYRYLKISGYNLILDFGVMFAPWDTRFIFNGETVIATDTGAGYKIGTATHDNLFNDAGVLVGTGYVADKSICPDGLWDRLSDFADWLTGLSLGVSMPGEIDVGSYPGVDTWPGEKTGEDDDIDVWPNTDAWPKDIGVTIPQDIADTIAIPTDIARDLPDEDTKPTEPTDPNVPPGKPPKVPPLSIPEIIFKKKFPFCLPWDLYNVFTGFLAEPEAPKLTIPFKVYDFDFSYTFDFSEYEEFAKISRFFLSIAFILGLIMVSRKMIGSE